MRVSNNMNYDQVKGNISKNRTEMNGLQNQAATMKRITKPSDDPVGTSRMLGLRTDGVGTDQFLKNMNMARGFLSYTDIALGEATDILMRAKELAIGQANDAGANAQSRLVTATEIDHLFQNMVNVGNRRLGERYIFGGYKTINAPFDGDGAYKGDDGFIKVEVSKGVFTSMNLPGDQPFVGAKNRIAQIPDERRGATTPNYPPAEPAEKPTSQPESLDKPTQAGPVEVRGPASTRISENVKGENPEAAPAAPAAENKAPAEGENVFKILKALSVGMRANDTVAIQETLEALDGALDQVIILRSQIGSRVSALENTFEGLTKGKIEDAALLSSIEDADAFEVFSDITRNENTLKATLQTSGKVIQPSLLDFLR